MALYNTVSAPTTSIFAKNPGAIAPQEIGLPFASLCFRYTPGWEASSGGAAVSWVVGSLRAEDVFELCELDSTNAITPAANDTARIAAIANHFGGRSDGSPDIDLHRMILRTIQPRHDAEWRDAIGSTGLQAQRGERVPKARDNEQHGLDKSCGELGPQ